MTEHSGLTLDQMIELEQWMYDQDALHGENYYDERMKLLREIEDRKNDAPSSEVAD